MSRPTGQQVDPAVDPSVPARRRQRALEPAILVAVAAGGILGAEARYALSRWFPPEHGAWPASTWWINVGGSLALGALMVVLTELTSPHRLLRPLLGVGVLGGFTTFSTAMVEARGLLSDGTPALALTYLVGTPAAALVAVILGSVGMRVVAAGWKRARRRRRSAR